MTITAAADGSALGNPGPAGWAWYVDDNCWRAGGWPHGTNNQGELMAVLDLFRATAHIPDEDLHILCDSQYVINAVTKWMQGWKRKGWRKADGKPVLNVDLLKDIDQALVGRKYTFEWVRGHAGHELNEAADERARAAATSYQQGVAVRQGPGFGPAGTTSAGNGQPSGGQGTPPRGAGHDAATAGVAPGSAAGPRTETLTREAGPFSQPDLFSDLDEAASVAGAASDPTYSSGSTGDTDSTGDTNPEVLVESLERELLLPATRADLGRVGVLLHPEFTEVGSTGRIWTRDASMMSLDEDPGGSTELELLGADRLGSETILLTYRSYTRAGAVLRSSLWVLDGRQWRLRFHQATPEV